jgi:hypothetical protein
MQNAHINVHCWKIQGTYNVATGSGARALSLGPCGTAFERASAKNMSYRENLQKGKAERGGETEI